MEQRREGGEYTDAEQRLQRRRLPEVCGGYGSRQRFTQVMENCRCSIYRANAEIKLLSVLNSGSLQLIEETKC